MTRSLPARIAAVLVLAAAASQAGGAARAAWKEGFEGPQPSWYEAGADVPYRVRQHDRVAGQPHSGERCEHIRLVSGRGTCVYMAHDVGRARVIEELRPVVWVKADRAGLQLLAEVALPRTRDPRTGRPISVLVGGSTYRDVGRWEQLCVGQIPQRLVPHVWTLRTQFGPQVDAREAYLARVLLNVYGGPGVTGVWIDDLELGGFARCDLPGIAPTGPGPPAAVLRNDRTGPARQAPGTDGGAFRERAGRAGVELAGSVLTVRGRPLFPRIIQYQGEPLSLLKDLGFNAVWLDRPPSPGILQEAERLDLWLVCPPPDRPESGPAHEGRDAVEGIGPQYDRVLAWDLGRGLGQEELARTKQRAERVRLADCREGRPLVCSVRNAVRPLSRCVDLLLIDRRPVGTSLELSDYRPWIAGQKLLARPGTPIWTTVQTQPAPALRQQLAALSSHEPPPLSITSEQIRLLAYTALSAGSRGLFFQSDTPLGASDPQTRHRAMALELINLELKLVELWGAAGNPTATVDAAEKEAGGTVLLADRARLVLPVWLAAGAQYVPGPSTTDRLGLVVPGVPESSSAYELLPGGLIPLADRRVTGGTRISLERFALSTNVLLAQDAAVVQHLTERARAIGPRAAQLARHLAADRLQELQAATRSFSSGASVAGPLAAWLTAARKSVQSCDGHFAARDYRSAYLEARRAMTWLRWIERAEWEAAVGGLASPVASPGAVSFATLPWHRELTRRIAASRPGPNQLPGGGFEDLSALLGNGWHHFQHPADGLQAAADLLPGAARSGFSGLRLSVRAEDPDDPPNVVETPPVWITTPALPVEAGQLVCIRGWVQVPTAIAGGVDGLLILDSFCGEALAERVRQTAGWQQFTLYRIAPESGRMTISFALTGLGEAWLDDVTVQTLQPAAVGGLTRRPGAYPYPVR